MLKSRTDEEQRGNVSSKLGTESWKLIGRSGKGILGKGKQIGKNLVPHWTTEKFDIIVEHRVYE